MKILIFGTLLFSLTASADISLTTTSGDRVSVNEDVLTKAYMALVNEKFNNKSQLPDGSVSFNNPGMFISGKMYSIGFVGGGDSTLYASGFCKNNALKSVIGIAHKGIDNDSNNTPIVFLNSDGSVYQYRDFKIGNEYTFAGIICK